MKINKFIFIIFFILVCLTINEQINITKDLKLINSQYSYYLKKFYINHYINHNNFKSKIYLKFSYYLNKQFIKLNKNIKNICQNKITNYKVKEYKKYNIYHLYLKDCSKKYILKNMLKNKYILKYPIIYNNYFLMLLTFLIFLNIYILKKHLEKMKKNINKINKVHKKISIINNNNKIKNNKNKIQNIFKENNIQNNQLLIEYKANTKVNTKSITTNNINNKNQLLIEYKIIDNNNSDSNNDNNKFINKRKHYNQYKNKNKIKQDFSGRIISDIIKNNNNNYNTKQTKIESTFLYYIKIINPFISNHFQYKIGIATNKNNSIEESISYRYSNEVDRIEILKYKLFDKKIDAEKLEIKILNLYKKYKISKKNRILDFGYTETFNIDILNNNFDFNLIKYIESN